MSPEYIVSVPDELEQKFLDRLNEIKDLTYTRLDFSDIDRIAEGAKAILEQIPDETMIFSLYNWNPKVRKRGIASDPPQEWLNFMQSLSSKEKGVITRSMDILMRSSGRRLERWKYSTVTIVEARNMRSEVIDRLGVESRARRFIANAFS